MAKRVIRTDRDPILRKRSREVQKFDQKLNELVEDMYETMDDAQGVGLAAVQVGILKRIVTVDDREENRFVMVNPVIEEVLNSEDERVEMTEGCLSVPGRQGKVMRDTNLRVSYFDLEGNKKEFIAEDFLAQIVQHELDHLNGKLYTDRAHELYELREED